MLLTFHTTTPFSVFREQSRRTLRFTDRREIFQQQITSSPSSRLNLDYLPEDDSTDDPGAYSGLADDEFLSRDIHLTTEVTSG